MSQPFKAILLIPCQVPGTGTGTGARWERKWSEAAPLMRSGDTGLDLGF